MPQSPHDELGFFEFYRPSSPARLQDALRARSPVGVRVRGALHSERGSVLSDKARALQVMVGSLSEVRFDMASGTVRAQAGTSLGGDPFAPGNFVNPQFHESLSLFYLMNRNGLAAPITGGITHQTISGFLATGADGGSLTHSFPAAVQELKLLDAAGTEHVAVRGQPLFDAALASLGLLGTITEVTLQCEPRYDVIGLRSTQPDSDADFALFEPAPNKRTIVEFLTAKPYARALWWPQPGIERVEFWEASRFDAQRHGELMRNRVVPPQRSGVPSAALQLLARVVLGALSRGAGQGMEARLAALLNGDPRAFLQNLAEAYAAFDPQGRFQLTWREFGLVAADLLARLADDGSELALWVPSPGASPVSASAYEPLSIIEQIVAALIDPFVPLSPRAAEEWHDWHGFPRKYSGQLFYDSWEKGLPMDNPVDDRLLPVTFTEAWIPIRYALPALRKLRDMFQDKRLDATGTFAIELYAARQSSAWLSPAYRGDVLRIDPFFFDNGDRKARDAFFTQYWLALEEFEPCYHWGKALPPMTDTQRARYPRLNEFLALREAMDPSGRFLTDYWRAQLGIG